SVLAAIGRNERLASLSQVAAATRRLLMRDDAAPDLLPVLARSGYSESETLDVLDRGWSRFTQPQRLSALEILFARSALLDQGDPPEKAIELLRRAVADPSVAVRERALSGLKGLSNFWAGRNAPQLFMTALSDDTPALRKLGLALTATRASFWLRPDAQE